MNFGFKKIITFLILIIVLYPNTSRAQFLNGGMGASAQGGFNIQGIGAVLASCANVGELIEEGASAVGSGVGALFGNSQMGGEIGDATGDALTSGNPLEALNAGAEIIESSQAVPVKDSVVREETEEIKEEQKKSNFKERCLDAIARFAILKVMDKITFKTVEWINSGFNGNPFFPENRPNFFEELAQDEVLNFTSWFSANPQDYPFGQAIAETILLSVQNRLQDNMRFSLNQVLQHSNQYANYESFTAQFSVGGWAGYTAMMQPNNNIFGNYLMANNHLARRTRGTNITIAENFSRELSEGLGVINQRKCARTAMSDSYYSSGDEYIGQESELHLGNYPLIPEGGTMTGAIYLSLPPAVQDYLDIDQNGSDAQAAEYNALVRRSTCLEWRTVTPGRFIAEQTTQVLGSPLRKLELGDEIHENLGLIFDALLNQLVVQGLRGFQNSSGQYSSDPNSPNYNALWAQMNNQDFGGQTQQPTVAEVVNGAGANNTGLLNVQQQYLVQATEAISTLETLIRDIRVLDYCVPGPNPRWFEFGSQNMQTNLASVMPQSGSTAWTYYGDTISSLIGVDLTSNSNGSVVTSHDQFLNFMSFVLNSYRNEMLSEYSLNLPPPSVRPAAAGLYAQIESYQNTIQVLQNMVTGLTSSIPQLQYIQSQINSLTPEEQNNPNNPIVQSMASLLSQLSSQGALATQDQLNGLNEAQTGYESLLAATNSYISQCVIEVNAPVYSGPNERAPYPFSSITSHPLYSQIPAPTQGFLVGQTFGDTDQEINLSTYGNLDLEVPSVSVGQFASFLQSVF